ncbi:molybdopterin cofactor-binding domain-containing protein [Orrella daihaiensis]|uniref:Molybdopterin-dependent oxidoreductase n=1 Tax=Orrella daihaiensis TaxID=2782176 RepID=A0ABY4AIL4_9BURK|nr:molybdopterin cofactor-binding domain-containing protein [Orrella daihaiensis]UOD50129.1 molybdopterin-dependent oxidoreductase [Orrella daihaiensis]
MTSFSRLTTRADFLKAQEVLLVLREPAAPAPAVPGQPMAVASNPLEGDEVLLAVWPDGTVTGLHGHVDLGTGLRTALTQLVAEELDVAVKQVTMVMGDTATAPNQGPTIASASIQIHGMVLRQAAAQARAYLLAQAANTLNLPVDELQVRDGTISHVRDSNIRVTYGELIRGAQVALRLDTAVEVKDSKAHRIIGQSVPRVDIPAKASGELVFVHDMRVPGMLHGRVIRPPYAGADHGDFIGNTLESVEESSISHIPGVVAVVVIRDFVGVVAEREEQAEAAMRALVVRWKPWPGLPDVKDIKGALSNNPAVPREVVNEGDALGSLQASGGGMSRTYLWPYQMHASLGPSCAVAHWRGPEMRTAEDQFTLRVWAGTQNPHVLRADLARLAGLQDIDVDLIRMEASGCYGRNGADDVAADALLLSRAVGAPVRVQLTREQENVWEPKGAAQWMEVNGAVSEQGQINAWDFSTSYPSNGAPPLALLLTRTIEPNAQAYFMGDRTARPPYTVPNLRVTVNDMPPILRASWLRGVSALPNSFAHESFVDELATAAGEDPVEFRLRHLDDPRASELLKETAIRAGWQPRTGPRLVKGENGLLQGQGVAYARYVHSRWPGFGAAWAAWVANVEVNPNTGEVHVRKVVVGHDAGLTVNPAGVEHQIHGNVIQATSRALQEKVTTEPTQNTVANQEWGSYPVLSFRQVPVIEVYQMPRPEEPPLGAGESSSVPGTAAIANAIFDATGVRFRQPPFTPEVVRAAINPLPAATDSPEPRVAKRRLSAPSVGAIYPRRKSIGWRALALAVGAVGIVAGVFGWRSPIAPVTRPSASLYATETIERGRQLAALSNCATCHTTADGQKYAGGVALPTPFGVIYSTNITPDPETGIGNWSLAAFERAMRQGISQDGRHLYPAFPYTAFSRFSDDEITSLYAYFMSQPAVRQDNPKTELSFPFSVRPALAAWNAIYPPALAPEAAPSGVDSEVWLRGEYLVNGPAHCSACHTPRDLAGAEKFGKQFLSGGYIKGWQAHDLTATSNSPVPWTEQAFYDYLRQGVSDHHGAALGPMADVVKQLSTVPDEDLRAMAVYLASFQQPVDTQTINQAVEQQLAITAQPPAALLDGSHRLFEAACAACHHDGSGPTLLGANVPLALNTNLHADQPDNLIRVILEGVRSPPSDAVGFMAGFADQFNDEQLVGLVRYMRARFAPQQPAWPDLENSVKRMREAVKEATQLAK